MTRVIFVGNCQAEALFGAYLTWVAPERGETVVQYVPTYEDADEAAREQIRQADVIVLQIMDTEQKVSLAELQTKGRVVMFPTVTGFFLWPFHTGKHPRDADIPPEYRKVFTGLFGDRWLDKRINRGDDPQDILERYRDPSVVTEANLDRLVELVATKQQDRDAQADMRLGDYIMGYLPSEQVFLHMHHPNLGLFALMVREVFSRLGCSSAKIEEALSHYRASPFPPEEFPIHPRIAEQIGLNWASSDRKYRFWFGERLTWDEFCQRYVAHDWGEGLQRSLARAHRDLPRAELEALAAELEAASARYDSSEGYFALCATRQRLGDFAGAMEAVSRAISVDPLSVGPAARRAELLAATGHLEDAAAAAEDVVAWQPHFAPGRIALLEAYYRLGRRQEAVREARAAFALAPHHAHVLRRLADLESASSNPQ